MNEEQITFIGPNPPPTKAAIRSGYNNTRWNLVIAELKKRPGEWALVGEGVSPNVTTLLKQRGCDAVSRNGRPNPNKGSIVYDVYACWELKEEFEE